MEEEGWKLFVKDAEVYYKLSEEMKLTHPLIAYFANLHGLRKVTKNLNKRVPKSIAKKVTKYL